MQCRRLIKRGPGLCSGFTEAGELMSWRSSVHEVGARRRGEADDLEGASAGVAQRRGDR